MRVRALGGAGKPEPARLAELGPPKKGVGEIRDLSIIAFLRVGQFGPVRCGMAEAELQEVLGEPTDTGGYSRKQRTPLILRFGDLEFGIDPEPSRTVCYVSLNKFSRELGIEFQGGSGFRFAKEGVLHRMPMEGFYQLLRDRGIRFELLDEFGHQVVRTESGARVYSEAEAPRFDPPQDEPRFLGKIIVAGS